MHLHQTAGLRSRSGAVLLLAGSLGASVLAGGMPWSLDFERDAFVADARTSERWAALHAIPAGASVQAPDPLLPHLARRARVHRAPPPERQTDFVVLDVSHRVRYAGREDLLRTTEEPYVRSFLARPDHAILRAGKELVVLARKRRPRQGLIKRYFIAPSNAPGIRLSECLRVYDALLGPHSLVLSLRVHANCPNDLALRLGADALPRRVDLLFDGVLSPALLRPGDHVASQHLLTPAERAAIVQRGLVVGLLRSSGARPEPRDPRAIRIPVRVQDEH